MARTWKHPTLGLAVEGTATRFPGLAEVAETLEALDLLALVPGRTFAPPSHEEFQEALPSVRCLAVRNAFCDAPRGTAPVEGGSFVAAEPRARADAVEIAVASAATAVRWRSGILVVELGPQPAGDALETGRSAAAAQQDVLLDRACRALYQVAQRSGVTVAVATPGAPPALPSPEMLQLLLEDQGRVTYWHDTGRARLLANLGLHPEETWLDRFARRCAGIDLSDCIGTLAGLPPGSGEVDFRAVRDSLGSETVRCLRVERATDAGPLGAALQYLRGVGY